MSLPAPSVLLNVPNFEKWYPGQREAFKAVMDWYNSPTRFLGLSQPTGSGKSCIAVLLAYLSGARTCVLTATKGLQDQILSDFYKLLVVVKGQNNFKCSLVPSLTAEEAPCHEGMSCSYARSGGCSYREQLQRALDAKIVSTNYAYYLAQTNFSSGLGSFDLLICDEGHMAFGAMENFLTIRLYRMDIEAQGIEFPSILVFEPSVVSYHRKKVKSEAVETPTAPDIWSIWQTWAKLSLPVVESRVLDLDAEIKSLHQSGSPVPGALSRTYRTAKSTFSKLQSLSTATGDWVIQRTTHGYSFNPRWVADYGHNLFGKIPKVMLMSAILSPKTADSLGVPGTGADRSWIEVDSYFPATNSPVWHVPTARINYRTDDYGATVWQARIDQIIQRRLDRKGIVFTVSYERARLLLSRSRFKGIMFTHSTGDVSLVVNRFKRASPPAVLVSPSVTTGYDFPGEGRPQYVIVGKIPYPDTKDAVVQARHQDDPDWSSYLAMETLVQECGRMVRSASDRCEVLVLDDSWLWFWPKYKEFAPRWFQERVQGSLSSVPEPLV